MFRFVRPLLCLVIPVLLAIRPQCACAYENILAGPYQATVKRVIDGDTLEVQVQIWLGQFLQTAIRLEGIDAPEMEGECKQEIQKAERSRLALAELVKRGDMVVVRSIRTDKYGGRVVARVYDRHGRDVSLLLQEQGRVRKYNGGKRGGWCD